MNGFIYFGFKEMFTTTGTPIEYISLGDEILSFFDIFTVFYLLK